MGKPLAIAPNAPSERVQALRAAYEATLRDPDFIKASTTAKVDLNPVPGTRLQEIVAGVLATPPELEEPAPEKSSGNRTRIEMGYRPASTALKDLVVLDLTHARAGPVCVRQLADWGANVVRIERPGNPEDFAARHEADFQNKHRNKRGMALNLRSEEGRAILYRMVEQGRRAGREFPSRCEGAARFRLRDPQIEKSAHHPRQHLRIRSGWAIQGPARRRSGRAGHERADVGDGRAGARADAGRDSDLRHRDRDSIRLSEFSRR